MMQPVYGCNAIRDNFGCAVIVLLKSVEIRYQKKNVIRITFTLQDLLKICVIDPFIKGKNQRFKFILAHISFIVPLSYILNSSVKIVKTLITRMNSFRVSQRNSHALCSSPANPVGGDD